MRAQGEQLLAGRGPTHIPAHIRLRPHSSLYNVKTLLLETQVIFGSPRTNILLAHFNLIVAMLELFTLTLIVATGVLPNLTYYWFLALDGPRTALNYFIRLINSQVAPTNLGLKELLRFALLASNIFAIVLALFAVPLSIAQIVVADVQDVDAASKDPDRIHVELDWYEVALMLIVIMIALICHLMASVPMIIEVWQLLATTLNGPNNGGGEDAGPLLGDVGGGDGDIELGELQQQQQQQRGGGGQNGRGRNRSFETQVEQFRAFQDTAADRDLQRAINRSLGIPDTVEQPIVQNEAAVLDRSLRDHQDSEYAQAEFRDRLEAQAQEIAEMKTKALARQQKHQKQLDQDALALIETRKRAWALDVLPVEIDSKQENVQVRIRLPSGEQVSATVNTDNKMQAIFVLVEGLPHEDQILTVHTTDTTADIACKYRLASAYPRVLYDNPEVTIKECNLHGKTSLVVELV